MLCAQTASIKFETTEQEGEFHTSLRKKAKIALDTAKVLIEQNIEELLKKHKLKKSVSSKGFEHEKSAEESPMVGDLNLLWNGYYTEEETKSFSCYTYEFSLPLKITTMAFSSMIIMIKRDAIPTKEI